MVIKKSINQFIRFAAVGVVNTLINLVVLYILTEVFGIYYLLSAIFAFLFAVTNSFILNTLLTFNEDISHKPVIRYTKFFIISTIALVINLILLFSLTEYLHLWYMYSQIISIFVSLWVNFFGNKIWTFKF